MKLQPLIVSLLVLFASQVSTAARVEEVRGGSTETPAFPEDLFARPAGTWAFAKQLWKGDEPCTADICEAGYTSGDLAVSVERYQGSLRIVAGFRGCASVAWNDYEVGDKASKRDTKTIGKRIKKTVSTSAKYCKREAPTVGALDASLLFPAKPQTAKLRAWTRPEPISQMLDCMVSRICACL